MFCPQMGQIPSKILNGKPIQISNQAHLISKEWRVLLHLSKKTNGLLVFSFSFFLFWFLLPCNFDKEEEENKKKVLIYHGKDQSIPTIPCPMIVRNINSCKKPKKKIGNINSIDSLLIFACLYAKKKEIKIKN